MILVSCTPINKQTLAILNCDYGDTLYGKQQTAPKIVLKKLDILEISITDATAKSSELSPCVSGFIMDGGAAGAAALSKVLMVDENGMINLNCAGEILVLGKTITDVQNEIKTKLKPFISNPLIVIRLKNFQYSVEGEVGFPGSKMVENTRITILEAISSSGGLKIFAQKDSILIIRELPNGVRERAYVNLNNRNIINSPYYYLQQNDYVYVPPTRKRKLNEDKTTDRYIGIGNAIIGSITSIVLLLVTLRNR